MNEGLPPGGFAARKLPVVIAAVLVTMQNLDEVCDWAGGQRLISPREMKATIDTSIFGFDLATLEGTLRVRPGEYVLRGVEGEFYPCKASIFDATYEALEASA